MPAASARRRALTLVAVAVTAALWLAGCSSGSSSSSGSASASGSSSGSSSPSGSASAVPSSTVSVPASVSLTDQGSRLGFGDTARVVYEPTQRRGSVLRVRVLGVRQGRLADFKGFILDDPYKRTAAYYYARVQVTNLGHGDVGGVGVPLWGVDAADTLLPAVSFTTSFAACPSKSMPRHFGHGRSLTTCLVYLAPGHGRLRAVSYRPSQEFDPITWTGAIAAVKAPAKHRRHPRTKG